MYLGGVSDLQIVMHLGGVSDLQIVVHLSGVPDLRIVVHIGGVSDLRMIKDLFRSTKINTHLEESFSKELSIMDLNCLEGA